MELELVKAQEEHLVFGLRNVDVSFANALRRIMLTEIPTMAIEYVNIEENDSPIHDEVLAHRLGLLPIKADANSFQPCSGREDLNPGVNCIELLLDFTARKQSVKSDGCVHVLTKHFRAVGGENSSEMDLEGDDDGNFMIHQDIVVAKLKPGQRLKLRCFAIRGTGADHIKWSPVSTAAYRATPKVTIAETISGNDAEALKKVCPKNVFDIEDGELIVADMGACSMCRECVRDPRGSNRIRLGRVENSFDFSVESVGAIPAVDVVRRAVAVLREKCTSVQDNLEV